MAQRTLKLLAYMSAVLFSVGCGSSGGGDGTAGDAGAAPKGTGGGELGGAGVGGDNGGESAAGTTSGGAASGGRATGGRASGGASTGGTLPGGTGSGGTVTGGTGVEIGGVTESGGIGGSAGSMTGGQQSTGGDVAGGRGGEPASGGHTSGGVPTAGTAGTGGVEPCHWPAYSTDCSQVDYFQCGWSAHCSENIVTAEWHEHVMCGGHVSIVSFQCTFPCPIECDPLGLGWPESGEELVNSACGGGQLERRVFVTSTTISGNLGGVAGADALCQGLADRNDLGGTWKAWLSDTTSSPATDFTRPEGGYVSVDRSQEIGGWTESGRLELLRPISQDETGSELDSGDQSMVWSGTTSEGRAAGENCDRWTSNSGHGAVGRWNIPSEWTQTPGTARDCSAVARLYCFEQ